MSDAKPINTPLHALVILNKDENDKKVYQTFYRGMITYFLYLIISRLRYITPARF